MAVMGSNNSVFIDDWFRILFQRVCTRMTFFFRFIISMLYIEIRG